MSGTKGTGRICRGQRAQGEQKESVAQGESVGDRGHRKICRGQRAQGESVGDRRHRETERICRGQKAQGEQKESVGDRGHRENRKNL